MRAYQQDTTTALAGCCSLLSIGRSLSTTPQGYTDERAEDAERDAVPHSPGRARCSCPYPPSGRRG